MKTENKSEYNEAFDHVKQVWRQITGDPATKTEYDILQLEQFSKLRGSSNINKSSSVK